MFLLLAIFFTWSLREWASRSTIAFLTQTPKPFRVGGAEAWPNDSVVGTGLILAVSSLNRCAVGIGSGIYLAEYGRNRFGDLVRFTADVLNGVPSIVIGIAVYSLVVGSPEALLAFSGAAWRLGNLHDDRRIARATEEMLLNGARIGGVREAALWDWGISKWRTTPLSILRLPHRLTAGSPRGAL